MDVSAMRRGQTCNATSYVRMPRRLDKTCASHGIQRARRGLLYTETPKWPQHPPEPIYSPYSGWYVQGLPRVERELVMNPVGHHRLVVGFGWWSILSATRCAQLAHEPRCDWRGLVPERSAISQHRANTRWRISFLPRVWMAWPAVSFGAQRGVATKSNSARYNTM